MKTPLSVDRSLAGPWLMPILYAKEVEFVNQKILKNQGNRIGHRNHSTLNLAKISTMIDTSREMHHDPIMAFRSFLGGV
jgi:hypothetical protein